MCARTYEHMPLVPACSCHSAQWKTTSGVSSTLRLLCLRQGLLSVTAKMASKLQQFLSLSLLTAGAPRLQCTPLTLALGLQCMPLTLVYMHFDDLNSSPLVCVTTEPSTSLAQPTHCHLPRGEWHCARLRRICI